jgi:hypothetical protein
VTARSKEWVCGRSFAGILGSNPTGGIDVSLVSVVSCQVDVSASDWSFIQRVLTSVICLSVIVKPRTMRQPGPPRGCRVIKKIKFFPVHTPKSYGKGEV